MPVNDLKSMDMQIKSFKQIMDDTMKMINEKIKTLDTLEAELERGVKRNA